MQESKDALLRHNLKIGLSASFLMIVTAAWTYQCLKDKERLRNTKEQIKNKSIIQNQTIIIAFQPLELFVRSQNSQNILKKQAQFNNSLSKPKKGLVSRVMNFFKHQAFDYQLNVSGKDLRKLFRQLKLLQNVRLMIYTKLEKELCLQILQSLGVLYFFQNKQIIQMLHGHKSAEEVDHDTRRVIVISALKEDQTDSVMSNNHNLVLDIGEQRLQGLIFEKIRNFLLALSKIGRPDSLHEDMNELAIQLELPLWNDQH